LYDGIHFLLYLSMPFSFTFSSTQLSSTLYSTQLSSVAVKPRGFGGEESISGLSTKKYACCALPRRTTVCSGIPFDHPSHSVGITSEILSNLWDTGKLVTNFKNIHLIILHMSRAPPSKKVSLG
jgi:hypothetical protein